MSPTTIPQLARCLQDIFQHRANDLARSTGFVRRQSKLTGALFVQTLVFSFLAYAQPTREQFAQTAAARDLAISAAAIEQRLTGRAARLLHEVLELALSASLNLAAAPVAIALLERFNGVYLHDSTQISLPPALADRWPGGGQPAALKLQTRLEFSAGQLHVALLPGQASDRQLPAVQAQWPSGALRLADLGYFDQAELAAQDAAGVFWLSHLPANLALFAPSGQRWDLISLLRHHAAQTARPEGLDLPVVLGAQARQPCRLLAKRVPRRVAAERRRQLHHEAQDKGEVPSALALQLADWVVFVTNVPSAQLSLAEALVLARVRWQIELVFKLWKSHGQIDTTRSHKPISVLCELYAKLLAVLIQHWTLVVGSWGNANRSLVKGAQLIRAHALALATAFGRFGRLCEALRIIQRGLQQGCRVNTRRKHPATYQLLLGPAPPPPLA